KGGHVTVGGIVYQGDSFPERFRGKYIAADLLGHAVYWHDIEPMGSTFRTSHGGDLLLANDTWFAPTDVTLGPDGSVYVADLYVSGGGPGRFDDDFAAKTLAHRHPPVRAWTVRLLGDDNRVSSAIARQLVELTRTEPDVTVRCQLACTARRLPARDGLPIVWQL